MKTINTEAIVLSRVDYSEADKIITLLTPNYGKIRLMARGVRKIKSKIAGGIELFSISEISFISGKGSLGTLISARLKDHYGHIINRLDRVQLGYDLIALIHKVTEDNPNQEYFILLQDTYKALDDESINLLIINTWFKAQLTIMAGHKPNLYYDNNSEKLSTELRYYFDYDDMLFVRRESGDLTTNHIRLLRFLYDNHHPSKISRINNTEILMNDVSNLVDTIFKTHINN